MFLVKFVEALAWQELPFELDILHAAYVARLNALLEPHASAIDRELGAEPLERWSDAERSVFLTAPEVSFRLLWPEHHTPDEARDFLAHAAVAHAAVARGRPTREIIWAVSGDRYATADGAIVVPAPGPSGLLVDVASPYSLNVDVTGERHWRSEPARPLDGEALARALERLTEATNSLEKASPNAWRVVQRFTKTLLLLPDPSAPASFASGSSGQFVGRSVLSNPHLEKVTPTHVADALVHEAIHSVLYMDEQLDPWVLRSDLYAGPMRVESPWTGNSLPLRPYLQACFVWYGLLALWARALETDFFPRDRVRERLELSLGGFLRGSLLARVEAVRSFLAPELVVAIEMMQTNVLDLAMEWDGFEGRRHAS